MVATDLSAFDLDVLGFTVRAVVAEKDGVAVAAAGVVHTDPPYAFAHIKDEMRGHPKSIVKVIKDFDIFLQMNYDVVYAVADRNENNAPRVLMRAGFQYYLTNSQGDVYRWQRQQYQ